MNFLKSLQSVFTIVMCVFSVAGMRQAGAETLISSNVDSRVIVAMQFDDAAVQSLLPEGWTLSPFPGGALAGANTLLIFADRYLAMDANGDPAEPSSYRAFAMASPARSATTDEMRTFVTKVYTTADGNDPYRNASPANISRRATVESGDTASPKLTEDWSLRAAGGEMSLSLSYTSGAFAWWARESRSFSNVDPVLHHLNRFEQLSDLAMSVPLDKALNGDIEITSSIPELAEFFGGQEETVGVIVIPMYVRDVFDPLN